MLKKTDIGLGFRKAHFNYIFEHWPEIDFFEIISENFMVEGGLPIYNLHRALERYQLVQHGVSLNLASQDELNWDYLKKLKKLTHTTQTPYVTDHLCWTGSHGHNMHDLLPFPYSSKMIKFIANKARIIQDYLELPFGMENLSSYVAFTNSEMSEWDFYRQVVEESGCYYMCDINNIFVSSVNHQFEPKSYVDGLDWSRVLQCHIAGHSLLPNGTIIDTHDHPVRDEVWSLYQYAWQKSGGFPTLLEWDDNFISFEETHSHALQAKKFHQLESNENFKIAESVGQTTSNLIHEVPSPNFSRTSQEAFGKQVEAEDELKDFQKDFCFTMGIPFIFTDESKQRIRYDKENFKESIVSLMVDREDFKGIDRLCIYNQQYWYRLLNLMQAQYPLMVNQLGFFQFNRLITAYLSSYPSSYPSLDRIDDSFPQFMQEDHEWNSTLYQQLIELDYIYSKNFSVAQIEPLQTNLLSEAELMCLADKPLPLQKGFSLYQSDWKAYDYRLKVLNLTDKSEKQEIEEGKQFFAIYRADNLFKVEPLTFISHKLMSLLSNGKPLSIALEEITENISKENMKELEGGIQTWFSRWTSLGWFAHPD